MMTTIHQISHSIATKADKFSLWYAQLFHVCVQFQPHTAPPAQKRTHTNSTPNISSPGNTLGKQHHNPTLLSCNKIQQLSSNTSTAARVVFSSIGLHKLTKTTDEFLYLVTSNGIYRLSCATGPFRRCTILFFKQRPRRQ